MGGPPRLVADLGHGIGRPVTGHHHALLERLYPSLPTKDRLNRRKHRRACLPALGKLAHGSGSWILAEVKCGG